MASPVQRASSDSCLFEWPTSPPPHPANLALAIKLCTALLPSSTSNHPSTSSITTGWSSNDVIIVSLLPHRFIVKLPRQPYKSSRTPAKCLEEAVRTAWAASHRFGPKVLAIDRDSGGFVMECIDGEALEMDTIRPRFLPQLITLLRQIHGVPAAAWMRRYDPVAVVKRQLRDAIRCNAINREDTSLLGTVVRDMTNAVSHHPWTPCHNDFHSQNVMMLRHSSKNDSNHECLRAIDFEDCDLGDPMWDLAYLKVNLELENDSDSLETLYRASVEERRRLRAYVPLAMAHCATWAALHGGVWVKHQEELLERLRIVMEI